MAGREVLQQFGYRVFWVVCWVCLGRGLQVSTLLARATPAQSQRLAASEDVATEGELEPFRPAC
eukprot:11172138-Lingulodinium_polyedra.AAC.1